MPDPSALRGVPCHFRHAQSDKNRGPRHGLRTLRLGRAFDVVFIHDAIDYMTTHHDLRLALETAEAGSETEPSTSGA